MLVDSSQFERGMVATRSELTHAKKVMRETATPAEKLETEIKKLNTAFNKGAITQETYNRKLQQLEKNYKNTTVQASRFSKVQKGIVSSLGNVRNLMGILAGATAVRGLGRTVAELDKVAKAAAKLNVSTEFLTRFQFAAAQGAGLGADQATAAIERMTVQLNKAGHETGRAKLILDKYNINLKDLVRSTPERTLFAVRNALNGIADETERNVIAGTIFGDTQSGLHVLLSQTSEQIGDLFQQSDELGNTLKDFDAKKVEEAADAIGRMTTSFNGFSRTFTTETADTMILLMDKLTGLLQAMPGGGADRGPGVMRAIEGIGKTHAGLSPGRKAATTITPIWIKEFLPGIIRNLTGIGMETKKQTEMTRMMLERMPEQQNRPNNQRVPRLEP